MTSSVVSRKDSLFTGVMNENSEDDLSDNEDKLFIETGEDDKEKTDGNEDFGSVRQTKQNCEFCTALFETKEDLLKHIYCIHGIEYSMCQETSVREFTNEKRKRGLDVVDSGGVFCNQQDNHLSGEKSVQNNVSESADTPKQKRLRMKEKQHQCMFCHKTFGHNKSLLKHMMTHSQESQNCCFVCFEKFPDDQSLKSHLLSHQDSEYRCQICQEGFSHKNIYMAHMNSHVSGKTDALKSIQVNEFECEVCHRTYTLKSSLNRHKKKHLLEHIYHENSTLSDNETSFSHIDHNTEKGRRKKRMPGKGRHSVPTAGLLSMPPIKSEALDFPVSVTDEDIHNRHEKHPFSKVEDGISCDTFMKYDIHRAEEYSRFNTSPASSALSNSTGSDHMSALFSWKYNAIGQSFAENTELLRNFANDKNIPKDVKNMALNDNSVYQSCGNNDQGLDLSLKSSRQTDRNEVLGNNLSIEKQDTPLDLSMKSSKRPTSKTTTNEDKRIFSGDNYLPTSLCKQDINGVLNASQISAADRKREKPIDFSHKQDTSQIVDLSSKQSCGILMDLSSVSCGNPIDMTSKSTEPVMNLSSNSNSHTVDLRSSGSGHSVDLRSNGSGHSVDLRSKGSGQSVDLKSNGSGHSVDFSSKKEDFMIDLSSKGCAQMNNEDLNPYDDSDSENHTVNTEEGHINTTNQIHKCKRCPKVFSDRFDLLKHKKKDHKEGDEDDDPQKCPYCSEVLQNKLILNRHLLHHLKDLTYFCEFCCLMFISEEKYLGHMKIHEGNSIYKCNLCTETFEEKQVQLKHIKSHIGMKPFKCFECSKFFPVKCYLESHMRIHIDTKPFKCHICDRGFSHSFNLTKHLRIHTGEKPYKCLHCNRQFGQKNSLNRHLQLHISDLPYSCGMCGKSFGNKSDVLNHQDKVHGGFAAVIGGIVAGSDEARKNKLEMSDDVDVSDEGGRESHTSANNNDEAHCPMSSESNINVKSSDDDDDDDNDDDDDDDGEFEEMDDNQKITVDNLDVHMKEEDEEQLVKNEAMHINEGLKQEVMIEGGSHVRDREMSGNDATRIEKSTDETYSRFHGSTSPGFGNPYIAQGQPALPYGNASPGFPGMLMSGYMMHHMMAYQLALQQQRFEGNVSIPEEIQQQAATLMNYMQTQQINREKTGQEGHNISGEQETDPAHREIICNNQFNTDQTPTGKGEFNCDECGKHFKRRNYLRLHMRVHTGEKPFKCELCGKCFSHSFNLTKHARTHTGEQPYQCTICDRKFSHANSLNRHMLLHKDQITSSNVLLHSKGVKGLFGNAGDTTESTLQKEDISDKIDPEKDSVSLTTVEEGDELNYSDDDRSERSLIIDIEENDYESTLPIRHRNVSGEHSIATTGTDPSMEVDEHFSGYEDPNGKSTQPSDFEQNRVDLFHVEPVNGIFNCPKCPVKFEAEDMFKCHWKIHSTEPKFRCKFCNKSFSRNIPFMKHMRTHSKQTFSLQREANVSCFSETMKNISDSQQNHEERFTFEKSSAPRILDTKGINHTKASMYTERLVDAESQKAETMATHGTESPVGSEHLNVKCDSLKMSHQQIRLPVLTS